MNQEVIGNFIRTLREEKGWTQEDLAEKLNVVREAISRWERGKGIPEITSLNNLSKIFNVSIEEILSGERNPKENITLKLYDNQNKLKKKLIFAIISILILILVLLGYYFITQYKQVKIYDIRVESNNFQIPNGIMVKTNDRIILNLDIIENKQDLNIHNIELYYLENDIENKILSTTNSEIYIIDYIDSSEYFDWKNFNYIIKNMYIKIYYNNSSEKLKLNIQRSYINDNIFLKNKNKQYIKINPKLNNNQKSLGEDNLEEKIKKSLIQKEENLYEKELTNNNEKILLSYDEITKEFIMISRNKNEIEKYEWYLDDDSIYYTNIEDYRNIYKFEYMNNKYTCLTKNICEEEDMKEKINNFKYVLNKHQII